MNRLDYLLLHVNMAISAIVYAMDLFTAINLIIFDRWSGGIKPAISFSIARWIFAVCIILSFLNLTYEYYYARAIVRRGSIAESFLDNVAFRYLSRYTRDGQGWKRFLVFAELGDTKRKVEHLALFTYVSFQGRQLPQDSPQARASIPWPIEIKLLIEKQPGRVL